MATETTAKGMSKDQVKMMSDFATLIEAREITKNVVVTKLIQSYTPENGYEITLEEHPKDQAPEEA